MKKQKKPRQLSLVKFDTTRLTHDELRQYPFAKGQSYLFLGEIPNMPGHCVVELDGKIVWGYHTDNFIELTEEEV